jgi:hypothetical protein
VAHGKPPQFAILNHAIADSGIARQQESTLPRFGNLEASVRSRDTDDAKRSAGDLIEAGLN